MSCFWKGLLISLNNKDLKYFKIESKSVKDKNIKQFIKQLKILNTKTINMTCNCIILSDKQLQENYDHIKNYDINSFNDGYYCSCSDPFLFLLSYLLHVNILHDYDGNIIKYGINSNKQSRTLKFNSNTEHFMAS